MAQARERVTGTITKWDDDRGFGFITPAHGSADIFVHYSAFQKGTERPAVGTTLSYELGVSPDGKPRAVKAVHTEGHGRSTPRPAGNSRSPGRPHGAARADVLAIFVLVGVGAIINARWPLPLWVYALYAVTSLIAFVLYHSDKKAAQTGGWRVSEGTLHFVAIVGGWPGAVVAQQVFRHKTSKQEFRSVFWLTIVANIVAFVVVTTPVLSWLSQQDFSAAAS